MKVKKTLGVAAAAVGTAALVAPLTVLNAGSVAAASDSVTWDGGSSRFVRTVSDTTPSVGETITVSTSFQRKSSDEYIYNIKDISNPCLTYVPGSAKWNGGDIASVDADTPGEVRVKAPSITSWKVSPAGLIWNYGSAKTFSVQYTVTAACATGTGMVTTMHYGGSLGDGTYQDKGPTITVAKLTNPGNPGDGGNGDPGDGNGDPGSGTPGDGNSDDTPGNDNGSLGSLSGGSLGGLFG